MSVRTIKITYDDQDLIIPDRRMIEHFAPVLPPDKKIGFYTYSATASDPGEGFFFVTRDTMQALINDVMYDTDALGKATLKFESVDASGDESNVEISIPHVHIGPLTRQLQSTQGETLYLLHLVDQRWHSAKMFYTGASPLYFNLTMPNGATFMADSLKSGVKWKWSEIADQLFGDSQIISTTATLAVPTDDPKSDPYDFVLTFVPAVLALDHVLACNGWVFVYDPFTTECTVEDIVAPVTPLRTALAGIADRLIMGGVTHAEYNYETWDESGDHDKYIGSDLYALPFNPSTTVPKTIFIIFQSRYADGRYPTGADVSADARLVAWATVATDDATKMTIVDPDFKNAWDSWNRSRSRQVFFDILPALRIFDSPWTEANAAQLQLRADYLAPRIAAGLVAPRGVLVYDGFHQIAPSSEIFRVSIGVENGIPITRLDLEYRPPAMFGATFDGRPTGLGITPSGNCSIMQRADGSYAVHANAPLTPFFNNTDLGDMCS